MPLARIITSHPEHTTAISRKLQQQGFSVELARPEDQHLPPADLEIQWPAGTKQTFAKVQANQLVIIREGSPTVERAPWPGR